MRDDVRDRCPHCRQPLPLDHDVRQTFCCAMCRQAAYWMMVSQQKRQERSGKTCRHCGKLFDAKSSIRQIFCCDKCAADYHNSLRRSPHHRKPGPVPRARISRTCRHCGDRFDARRPEQIFCCHDCAASTRRAPINKICRYCGEGFDAVRKEQIFCGKGCAAEFQNNRRQKNFA